MMRVLSAVAAALVAAIAVSPQAQAQSAAPQFAPEPFWPKPLPENWILGQVAGIASAPNGNIWVLHRPASLLDDEKGATKNPPEYKCCKAAPPVLEFDADGNLLRHWGGAGAGHEWVKNEHGIHVDRDGNVWVGGNNEGDQILQFTADGKFIRQIGKDDGSKGSNSNTRLGRPAHMFTDDAANEIYVAGGYGNRRVIVFDMKTGAYKRRAPTALRRTTTSRRPIRRLPSRRNSFPIRCTACASRMTASSTSATAPTTASRCSARTAAS